MPSLSCFCMRSFNGSVWARTWLSLWSPASLQFCSDMPCVCLISSSAALIFSSWLQATHISVAYRFGKSKYKHNTKIAAIACERRKISYSEVASHLLGSVTRPTLAWERQLGFRRQSSWCKFQILKFRTLVKWYGAFVEWMWQVDVKVLREKQFPTSLCLPQIPLDFPGIKRVSLRGGAGN